MADSIRSVVESELREAYGISLPPEGWDVTHEAGNVFELRPAESNDEQFFNVLRTPSNGPGNIIVSQHQTTHTESDVHRCSTEQPGLTAEWLNKKFQAL